MRTSSTSSAPRRSRRGRAVRRPALGRRADAAAPAAPRAAHRLDAAARHRHLSRRRARRQAAVRQGTRNAAAATARDAHQRQAAQSVGRRATADGDERVAAALGVRAGGVSRDRRQSVLRRGGVSAPLRKKGGCSTRAAHGSATCASKTSTCPKACASSSDGGSSGSANRRARCSRPAAVIGRSFPLDLLRPWSMLSEDAVLDAWTKRSARNCAAQSRRGRRATPSSTS